MADGARNALVGYLYQIVGAGALRALVLTAGENDDELSCDLISLVGDGELRHEMFGGSIRVTPSGSRVRLSPRCAGHSLAWGTEVESISPRSSTSMPNPAAEFGLSLGGAWVPGLAAGTPCPLQGAGVSR